MEGATEGTSESGDVPGESPTPAPSDPPPPQEPKTSTKPQASVEAPENPPEKQNPTPAAPKLKVEVVFKYVGNAPILKKNRFNFPGDWQISSAMQHLKNQLKLGPSESLFLYVNQLFAPAPDQIIKNLYDCFGTDGKLILNYSITQAWG